MLSVAIACGFLSFAADLGRDPAEIQLIDAATGAPATEVLLATVDETPASSAAAMTALRTVLGAANQAGRLNIPANNGDTFVVLPNLWPTHGDRLLRSVDPNALDTADIAYAPAVISRDTLRSGQPVRLETATFHRAHVRFPVDVCQKTFFYDVALTALDHDEDEVGQGATAMLGRLECGTDFTVSGLLPGRYRIEILQEYATSDDRDWARLPFEIIGGNVGLVVGK